ncbi:RNA 2',3'-cyclic phosphodiesterase [Porticoccus sp.]
MVPPGYRRLFIALPVPADTGKRLAPYCTSDAEIRWIAATNRHLTLAFLGHRTEEQTRRAAEVVNGLEAVSFELQLVSLQRFPDDRGRNIVALPSASKLLEALQQQLTACLTAQGFTLKERSFRPHITLGKIHRGLWPAIGLDPAISMSVEAASLFESEFIENDIVYHPLTTRQLA